MINWGISNDTSGENYSGDNEVSAKGCHRDGAPLACYNLTRVMNVVGI
jgi:hypothetical protein